MKLLIDTHVLLWLLYTPDKIGKKASAKIDSADEVFVSTVSLFEIAIQHGVGKLQYDPDDAIANLDNAGLCELAILNSHITTYKGVKISHGDPFDRMLLAQASAEKLTLVTADELLLESQYGTIDARK